MLSARDFNLIAGIDAETPRMFAVAVERCRNRTENRKQENRDRDPLQTMGCLFRK
jgi:hypothetical protein